MILGVDPDLHGAIVGVEKTLDGHWISGLLDINVDFLADPLAMRDKIYITFPATRRQFQGPLTVVEGIHTMTGDGPVGAFTFGKNFGILIAVLRIAGCRVIYADPAVWKAASGLTNDKALSLARARETFPEDTEIFRRKKDHGRAEAALLAVWGERFLVKPPKNKKEEDLL